MSYATKGLPSLAEVEALGVVAQSTYAEVLAAAAQLPN
jgi:hypothetical protein